MPMRRLCFAACLTAGFLWAAHARGLSSRMVKRAEAPNTASHAVRLAQTDGKYTLTVGGRPYFIKGAGGDASKPLLRQCGGNSFRTWGADDLDRQLAEAQSLNMTVAAGIWLGHKDQGFSYHDPAQVAAQYASARSTILRYRHSPALLVWSLGNEMESGQEDDPAVWTAIEDIAAMAKKLDPDHPTMTVIAEVGGDKVAQINRYCPDIDIVGINSYAGASSVAARYRAAGGVKPFVLTEFGPPGTWEVPKNTFGAAAEPTSTDKATWYRNAYVKSVQGQSLCLGSYAFTWGSKQEATATWFGMLLPDGSRLAAVDTMTEAWTGQAPAHPCPAIRSLTLNGPDQVAPGATVRASLDVSSAGSGPVKVAWVLQQDPVSYHIGGASEASPQTYPEAIEQSSVTGATVQVPSAVGAYRLFAYIRGAGGGAAVANIPLFVQSSIKPPL